MNQDRAALDVSEELVPQPGPLGRALDQSRDVGQHGLPVIAFDRAQHRRERREWVVRDLRRRPRQPRQQGGLPRVRQPHQPDVGQQLQPQLDPASLPTRPLLREPRRLPRRVREPLVPMSPTPTMRDHGRLSRLDQVHRAAVNRRRLRPRGHSNLQILPPSPMPVGPFPVPSPLGPEVLAALQGPQIPLRLIANQHNVPAVPPVPPVGPTPRHVRLASKRDRAIPAGPALNPDFRLVVHRNSEGRCAALVFIRPEGE